MNAVIIASDNDSDLKKIVEFARKLKLKARTKKMTAKEVEEMEDAILAELILDARKSEYVSEAEFMKTLENQKNKLSKEKKSANGN